MQPGDVAMQQAARERPSPDKGGDDKRNKIAGIRINGLNAFADNCTSTWEKEVPMYNVILTSTRPQARMWKALVRTFSHRRRRPVSPWKM